MTKSSLPFGSEFSPSTVDLPWLLEAARQSNGDKGVFENAVYEKYFQKNDTSESNRRTKAMNVKLALNAYGIIKGTQDTDLTDFGEGLYTSKDDETLYRHLAKHILLNLHGLTMVETIKDMQAGGSALNLVTLRESLGKRGVHFPPGGKHPSMMRLWLAKAGVFGAKNWQISQAKVDDILGVTEDDIEALSGLNGEQRVFLRSLANIGDRNPRRSNEIAKLAAATYGVRFDEKKLPQKVLRPLENAGFIALQKGTTGQGAKPFLVTPTDKLVAEVFEPILEQAEGWADKDLRGLLRMPLEDILSELESPDTYRKGLALEGLAFKLMRLLDMTYVRTRLRGNTTGGAEVDLIFESNRLVFSRWQVFCSTAAVDIDTVATTVGLTPYFQTRVAFVICSERLTERALEYAAQAVDASRIFLVLMDGGDLAVLRDRPGYMLDLVQRQAPYILARAG